MSFPFTVPLTPKEVRTTTVTQSCPLGTRGQTADGRVYRYARNGAVALVKGLLVQQEVPATGYANATGSCISTGISTELGTTYLPTTLTSIHLSSTMGGATGAISADYYKEGWLWVNSTGTNAGQMIRIKSHNVASSNSTGFSSTGGQLYVQFDDGYGFSENLDTASFIALIKNEYADVIVAPATLTAQILGVPNCAVAASSTTVPVFFWLQTWGPCAIKTDATASILAYKPVFNSTSVGGGVQGVTGSTDLTGVARFGVNVGLADGAMQTITGAHQLVHLTLAP